jgi:hypothetical protein
MCRPLRGCDRSLRQRPLLSIERMFVQVRAAQRVDLLLSHQHAWGSSDLAKSPNAPIALSIERYCD